jgi:hypothetical protein
MIALISMIYGSFYFLFFKKLKLFAESVKNISIFYWYRCGFDWRHRLVLVDVCSNYGRWQGLSVCHSHRSQREGSGCRGSN